MVGVPGVAGRKQQPPAPVEARDRRARLVVGPVRRQLEPVAEPLVGVPGSVAAGEVGLRGEHVLPAAYRGFQQLTVAGLGCHVGYPGFQVQRAHHVSHLGTRRPDRHVVLQVAAAHAGIPGQSAAPLVDELPGEREVIAVPGLPVQLDKRGLDDRVPVQALGGAEELAHQVVGEPRRHGEKPVVADAAAERDRGLDEVPGAVHLVARRQARVARFAGHLEVGVQVSVGQLRPLKQRGDLGGEIGESVMVAQGQLPANGLQGFVDVGVHEDRPAVRQGGAGATLDRQPYVVQVPRGLQLPQRDGQALRQVALLPVMQQASGEPCSPGGVVRPVGGRGHPDRAIQRGITRNGIVS